MEPKTKRPRGEGVRELGGELAAFLNYWAARRDLAPKSRYRYRGILLNYQDFLGGNDPTPETSEAFLLSQRAGGYKSSSLKLAKGVLTAFHRWRGEREPDLVVKQPSRAAPFIEKDVIEAILNLARQHSPARDFPALLVMADAGLRRGEVNLECSQVHLVPGLLTVKGKGGKGRVVPLTTRLRQVLAEAIKGKNLRDPVVEISEKEVYLAVRRYGAQVGHPELHPHDFRHAFACRLREAGVDLKQIQELLGHSRLDTTGIYAGVSPQHLVEAIERLEGSAGSDGFLPTVQALPEGLVEGELPKNATILNTGEGLVVRRSFRGSYSWHALGRRL